jgi:uncharacterized cupredoxin-like copper-binding protein
VNRFATVIALLAVLALAVAACGGDDAPSSEAAGGDGQVVQIEMVDIAFEPTSIEVEEGETVTFRFTNSGEVVHDAVIGDRHVQDDHEAEMAGADDGHGAGHGDGHDEDADALVIDPGGTGELTYTFDDAGTLEIGCHQPGHYDAGMKVTVDVV